MQLFLKLLPIILSLCSFTIAEKSLAREVDFAGQTQVSTITPERWHQIATRYYQSRYRTKFQDNNHLLSLREVRDLLGTSGVRLHTEKDNPYQSWQWRDRQNPQRKIRGIFVFDRLVSLKGYGFDSVDIDKIKTNLVREAKAQDIEH